MDTDLNYYKLCYSSCLIQKGVPFIVTYKDPTARMKKYIMPIGGCLAKALEFATGKEGILVGKPNPTIFDVITKTFGMERSKCLMIGDNIDSDILLGKNSGVDTFLVLSGVGTEEQIQEELRKENGVVPNYYWEKCEF